MSYTVVIVESPAKCKKIEGYLGPNYKCIASFGHIQELNGIKSIEIDNNFKPNFNLLESKIQQINKIKTLLKNSKEVLIASDDDREGEAIGWHICQVFKLPLTSSYTLAGPVNPGIAVANPIFPHIDDSGSTCVLTCSLYLRHIEPIFNIRETGILCTAGI